MCIVVITSNLKRLSNCSHDRAPELQASAKAGFLAEARGRAGSLAEARGRAAFLGAKSSSVKIMFYNRLRRFQPARASSRSLFLGLVTTAPS